MPETKREIDDLRKQMALLDARLVGLLDERARTARRIGELRRDQAAALPPGTDASLEELVGRSSGDLPAQALRHVLSLVLAECASLEAPVTIAVGGEDGGAAHAAARSRFGSSAGWITATSAAQALDDVAHRRAELAVVLFETSAGGLVQPTLTALVSSDLRVVEVLEHRHELHLANRSGRADDVGRVHGSSADLARCRRTIFEVTPRASIVESPSPAAACRAAFEDGASAALVLETTAGDAGLAIARRGMLDGDAERARFALVGTRPTARTGRELTSFVFAVKDDPAALLDVLRVFAERGIPLTKLDSHPTGGGESWSYLFLGETVGHFTDRPLVIALEEVKRLTRSFRLLGSYPAPSSPVPAVSPAR